MSKLTQPKGILNLPQERISLEPHASSLSDAYSGRGELKNKK